MLSIDPKYIIKIFIREFDAVPRKIDNNKHPKTRGKRYQQYQLSYPYLCIIGQVQLFL